MTINETFFADGSASVLYGEYEVTNTIGSIARSGISVSDGGVMDFTVTVGTGQITVASGGIALLDGMPYKPSADKTITVSYPTSKTRIDRIVIRRDMTNHVCSIIRIAGTESDTPTAPQITRDSSYYELSLCQLKVTTAGAISILKDERSDTDLCGAIRTKGMTEFNDYFRNIRSDFAEWFTQQQGIGWRQIAIQSDEPTDQTDGAIWIDTSLGTNSASLKQLVSGAYTAIDLTHRIDYFGACMAGDTVQSGTKTPIGFNKADEGFSIETEYATLQSGKVKILKTGYYRAYLTVHISDGPSGVYHVRLYNQRTDANIGENYAHTSTITPNICSGGCSGFLYAKTGDLIVPYLAPPNYSNLYRINAAHTALRLELVRYK